MDGRRVVHLAVASSGSLSRGTRGCVLYIIPSWCPDQTSPAQPTPARCFTCPPPTDSFAAPLNHFRFVYYGTHPSFKRAVTFTQSQRSSPLGPLLERSGSLLSDCLDACQSTVHRLSVAADNNK